MNLKSSCYKYEYTKKENLISLRRTLKHIDNKYLKIKKFVFFLLFTKSFEVTAYICGTIFTARLFFNAPKCSITALYLHAPYTNGRLSQQYKRERMCGRQSARAETRGRRVASMRTRRVSWYIDRCIASQWPVLITFFFSFLYLLFGRNAYTNCFFTDISYGCDGIAARKLQLLFFGFVAHSLVCIATTLYST